MASYLGIWSRTGNNISSHETAKSFISHMFTSVMYYFGEGKGGSRPEGHLGHNA